MDNPHSLRSPLKRARRLGSSHEGTHHFWLQRVSAVALVPLSIWFVTALVTRLLSPQAFVVAQWLRNPLTALALGALVFALFMHARLGIQTIIEDYVKCEVRKIALLLLLNTVTLGLGAMSLMAVFKLHFFGI